jgi:tyrosyl-tRNA synthetase
MNFIKEMEWRGMLHNVMPGTEELLEKEQTTAYLGIDPTADSLHIGHLAGVMLLRHFQRAGHRPIALIGGATGMIGDPSGKSQERNLLDEETLRYNQEAIKKQLSKFINFENGDNKALLVNNYDWMKEFNFLSFLRNVGKHLTVNYMIAKDSVKKRMSGEGEGISFTEFTYQLVQGYDFLHLYENYQCKLQMGGSDQWGNITTGTELIRRKARGEAYAFTMPLITKADGTKFGKTEKGNIWLSPEKTSPYHFYQFWINVSDEDAEKYIKIFTMLSQNEINDLVKEHKEAPHLRLLQKKLAHELTIMVHSSEMLEMAMAASDILFGKNPIESINKVDAQTFLDVFSEFPQFEISAEEIVNSINLLDLLCEKTNIFPSKGELRRIIKGGGVSLNQEKISNPDLIINSSFLLKDRFLLIRKGKKEYFLIKSV